MKFSLLVLATLCFFVSMTTIHVQAQIYTWTDENGKVHYSDKPAVNQEASTIKPKTNNNIAKPVSNHNQWQQDYAKTKKAKSEQFEKQAKDDAKKERYCNALKSEYALYQQGGRFYTMSPEGERIFPSDSEIATKKKAAAKLLKKHCQ